MQVGYGSETVVAAQQQAPAVALPNKQGTYKFGVLGDFGTGSREQYELAQADGQRACAVQVRARDPGG